MTLTRYYRGRSTIVFSTKVFQVYFFFNPMRGIRKETIYFNNEE